MAGPQKKQPMVITVSGDRSIHDVAADLRKAGFIVKQVLDAIGSITGSAEPDIVEQLRNIPGVADVSADFPVDIGPPGAPVS
jgi:hypothetical protein